MRLRQIEIFHAVYSTGSVSKAADLLNVSQPSVSKVLRHTEDTLGFQLFERSGGKLTPTKEAQDLFKDAVRVQSEVDRLNGHIKLISEQRSGSLRVAMTPGIGLQAGPEALAAFHKDYPEIVPHVETLHFESVVEALFEGRADLGIVYQPFPQPGITQEHLIDAEFVCVGEKAKTFKNNKLQFRDLNDEKLITLSSQAPLGKLLSAQLERNAPRCIEATTANTYHIAKNLAAKGVGLAIIDEVTAKSAPTSDISISYFENPVVFSITAIFLDNKLLARAERQFLLRVKNALKEVLGRS